MMVYVILIISIAINALLMWYGYKLIKRSLSYSENIYFLTDDVEDFMTHLKAIYELETFYGDDTLQNLVLHSKQLRDSIEVFKQNSILEIEEEEKGLIEYEENSEEEAGP